MGEIVHKVRTGHPYWTIGFGLLIAFLIAVAVSVPSERIEEAIIIYAVAIVLLLVFPDMHTYFGTDGIKMTFGIAGIWRKGIRREDVKSVTVIAFSGLMHFGGWGIRYGFGKFSGTLMWGMPVRGSRGIWVETAIGKKYLIPDQNPDDTAENIKQYYPVISGGEDG
jgi:hypothetical protein